MMRHTPTQIAGAALAVLLLLALALPAQGDPSRRYQRLDASEQARAIAHARDAAHAASAGAAARAIASEPRSEVLMVERHRGGKDPALAARRLVDVYVYDYDADQLARSVVDLDTDEVLSRTVVSGVQLPLTEAEVARARALVFADAALAARIRADYRRVSNAELADPAELKASGFVFRADSMPGARAEAAAVCGRHRCAQLLLRTQDEVALELPIVDLSTEQVLDSRSFGLNRAERSARGRAIAPPKLPQGAATGHSHDHGGAHDH